MNIALFGNPNTGKTSLFNALTGSYEYVGNWSGVTVEKKVGSLSNKQGHVVDLPGIYSLNPLSKDESVATHFLINESFTEILNIVDASQLERNLHLTIQLLEFGKPVIMALNMIDVAKGRGITIDEKKLSELLKIPVIPVVARSEKGIDQLSACLIENSYQLPEGLKLYYGSTIEKAISTLIGSLDKFKNELPPLRWLAIQFFEGNKEVWSFIEKYITKSELQELFNKTEAKLIENNEGNSLLQVINKTRKSYITQILIEAVHKASKKDTFTEKVDMVLTNKFLGIPLFLVFMFLMFMFTFDWFGSPMSDLLDGFFAGPLSSGIEELLTAVGASSFIKALVLEGIVAGVGGVLVFVPQIFILFFFISFLEDSGYMARVALVMDRVMETIGLNGKAFIPLIIGFGCNVPGVMAARTIEQPKERLLTTLLLPLMSCSARLPVYALLVGAFFGKNQALVILSLYVLGIVVAFILGKIFSSTLLKNEASVFVIELPPYRVPQFKSLSRSTWDKGKGFIRKAGTFIFGGSVVIWLLTYLGPGGVNVHMDDSFLAYIGGVLAPLLSPLGFGTWQASASLLTGFLAKEVVVSSMNIIYHVPDVDSLQTLMKTSFTPLAAYSFMVFVLLYIPCLATVATIQKETRSVKWTAFSMGYALFVAYIIALVVYQGGKLIGLT